MTDYHRLCAALTAQPLPLAFVDLTGFDANLEQVLAVARRCGKKIRWASKSIRCVELLRRAVDRDPAHCAGVMAFTVSEAAHLVDHEFADILIAYPSAQPSDLKMLGELNQRPGVRVALVIDSAVHLTAIEKHAGGAVPVVIELDMAWRLAGGAAHLGVRRSPLHSPAEVVELAKRAVQNPSTPLHGFMGYEAQVAGLPDRNPFARALNPFKSVIRQRSVQLGAKLRSQLAEQLSAAGIEYEIFNGGGSGSLEYTGAEDVITEVAAGSALLAGHLFDYYSNVEFEPCAHFVLAVSRQPAPAMVTCLGGGYVASGEAGVDRLPKPVWPKGLALTGAEGAGEVQTPLFNRGATPLAPGDPVVFRHAKSGELAERFSTYHLVDAEGGVTTVPTYRGEGKCFL